MIDFKAPFRGQQVLTDLGSEQIASSQVAMIIASRRFTLLWKGFSIDMSDFVSADNAAQNFQC